MKKFILVLFLTLFSVNLVNAAPPPSQKSRSVPYINNTYNFQVELYNNWIASHPSTDGLFLRASNATALGSVGNIAIYAKHSFNEQKDYTDMSHEEMQYIITQEIQKLEKTYAKMTVLYSKPMLINDLIFVVIYYAYEYTDETRGYGAISTTTQGNVQYTLTLDTNDDDDIHINDYYYTLKSFQKITLPPSSDEIISIEE